MQDQNKTDGNLTMCKAINELAFSWALQVGARTAPQPSGTPLSTPSERCRALSAPVHACQPRDAHANQLRPARRPRTNMQLSCWQNAEESVRQRFLTYGEAFVMVRMIAPP